MQPDNKQTEKGAADSEETKKSVDTGNKVIELNKKLSAQDGKDAQAEEAKDQKEWREGK